MNVSLPDFSKVHILVLGDIMLDRYVWGAVERISSEAPIPVVHVQKRSYRLGGAGNVAANLAGLGCQVSLAGVTGYDQAGDVLEDQLAEQGIGNACIRTQSFNTITKTRIMGGSQQIVRLDDELIEVPEDEFYKDVLDVIYQKMDQVQAVVVSDYGKGVITENIARECIKKAHEKKSPVFIDPKRTDWTIYKEADCLTPNLKEFQKACELCGINILSMDNAARQLIKQYNLYNILVTQGSEGMTLLSDNDSSQNIPSTAREVFDVSGAGDTAIALMAAGVAANLSWQESMELANLGAGEVVAHVGTYALSKADLAKALSREAARNIESSICSIFEAKKLATYWRTLDQRIVFTNGCFDILHPGHISLLRQAKKFKDKLVVGLNTDASVKRIKGNTRPILKEQDRASILSALDCVDLVVYFDQDTPIELIQTLQPDVLVKGSDYSKDAVVGADLVESWGGRVELVDLVADNSTSGIIERIVQNGTYS